MQKLLLASALIALSAAPSFAQTPLEALQAKYGNGAPTLPKVEPTLQQKLDDHTKNAKAALIAERKRLEADTNKFCKSTSSQAACDLRASNNQLKFFDFYQSLLIK